MKRFIIIAVIVLSLVSIAAVTLHHTAIEKTEVTTTTTIVQPVAEPSRAWEVSFADTSALFKIEKIKTIKASPEQVVRAWKLTQQAMSFDNTRDSACLSLSLFREAMALCPLGSTYYQYANAVGKCNGTGGSSEKIRDVADMVHHIADGAVIVPGAAYALAQGDTALAMELLEYIVYKDTNAYKLVIADRAFHAMENYPRYYYLMDEFLTGASGQMAALRTLRMGSESGFPYELKTEALFKQYEYKKGDHGRYISPYTLQDDAMRDIVRGDRFNRFSRMSTDHSVQYVTTLHLSDKFYSFICSRNNDQSYSDDQEDNKVNIPYKFYLVNVNKTGYKIAEQQIGCSCSPIHISNASMDSTGAIEVRDLKQIWEKDPLKNGYKNNKVASTEVTAVKHYRVKEDGKIEAVSDATVKE